MTSVSMAARPETFMIDLDRSAVIVVDMQNDFGAEGGMFDRAGIDIAPIRRLVPRIAGVLDDARAAGLPIIYTKQQHRPDLADAGGPGAPHSASTSACSLGSRSGHPTAAPAASWSKAPGTPTSSRNSPRGRATSWSASTAPRSDHEASLLTIELLFGWIADSADLRLALRAHAGAQPVAG